jgi:hypothetical protein
VRHETSDEGETQRDGSEIADPVGTGESGEERLRGHVVRGVHLVLLFGRFIEPFTRREARPGDL